VQAPTGTRHGRDGAGRRPAPLRIGPPRMARRPLALVAALAMAGATLVSPPALACGYHSAADMALGLLNWSYPNALHVRTAVWQAENTGVLPPRLKTPAKDLFAFNRVARTLDALGAKLNPATPDGETASFSLVLLDSMMWTSFDASSGGYRVLTHVDGPASNDVVVVTHSKVVAAIVGGELDASSAESFGLVRLYGPAVRLDAVRRALGSSDAAMRNADSTTAHLTEAAE
jgi:hypothetical protein